jgi:hypothetical protein
VTTLVTVCARCGQALCAVPVEEEGGRWDAAEKWGYVAQQKHNRVCAVQLELVL